jgi:hypothetical protein
VRPDLIVIMLPAEPVGTLTQEDRRELAGFLDHSVLPSTKRAYDAHWGLWKAFLKSHTSILDPFLRTVSEAEKPGVVSLFLHKRFKQGLRCKQATAPTAGIKLAFARALLPTEFLNHPTVAAARHACRRKKNSEELYCRGTPCNKGRRYRGYRQATSVRKYSR